MAKCLTFSSSSSGTLETTHRRRRGCGNVISMAPMCLSVFSAVITSTVNWPIFAHQRRPADITGLVRRLPVYGRGIERKSPICCDHGCSTGCWSEASTLTAGVRRHRNATPDRRICQTSITFRLLSRRRGRIGRVSRVISSIRFSIGTVRPSWLHVLTKSYDHT